MTNNEKHEGETREVPIVEEDFATLLSKFRIKPEVATNISNNISHIGGQTVFENPELLTKKLAAWSTEISPSKRKLIIEQWFAERGIEVPEEVIEKAGKGPGELRKEAKGKEESENIYYVDSDTAIIRLAAGNEKATTLTEAKELQKLIKKDLEEARKRQKAEEGGKEPAFIPGEQGTWTLNPLSKMGFGEFAVFQMYQDSLRRGEPIDPVEELTKRAEQSTRLKEAMGVKTGGEDTEMTMLDKLDKLGMLKKGEGEGGLLTQLDSLGLLRKSGEEGKSTQIDMLDKMNQLGLLKKPGEEGRSTQMEMLDKMDSLGMLKKPGEEDAGSPIIAALQTEVKELKESLQKQEMDSLKNVVVSISNQVSELRKEMSNQGKLEGRYALLEKTITTIDSQLSGIRSDVKPLVMAAGRGGGSEPSKKSPEDKARISKGLKEAVGLEREARALEDELLFGGSQG